MNNDNKGKENKESKKWEPNKPKKLEPKKPAPKIPLSAATSSSMDDEKNHFKVDVEAGRKIKLSPTRHRMSTTSAKKLFKQIKDQGKEEDNSEMTNVVLKEILKSSTLPPSTSLSELSDDVFGEVGERSQTSARKPLRVISDQHVQILENIKNTLRFGDCGRGVEIGEDATEHELFRRKTKDPESHLKLVRPKYLLPEIRGLPFSMDKKREYWRELAKSTDAQEQKKYRCRSVMEAKEAFGKKCRLLGQKLSFWDSSFKEIEGRLGTGVVSYFIFLKWLFLLNIFLFAIKFFFIIMPSELANSPMRYNKSSPANVNINVPEDIHDAALFYRHLPPTGEMLQFVDNEENLSLSSIPYSNLIVSPDLVQDLGSLLDDHVKHNQEFLNQTSRYGKDNNSIRFRKLTADFCWDVYRQYLKNLTEGRKWHEKVLDLFEGTGWMENTTMFMGYYLPAEKYFGNIEYSPAVAFILVIAFSGMVNMLMMISYASKGVKESILEEHKGAYSGIVFCGWDFCIEEHKASKDRQLNIFNELMSLLAEDRRKELMKKWTNRDKTRIYCVRVISTIINIAAVIGTYYLLIYVVHWQVKVQATTKSTGMYTLYVNFLPSLTLTCLNFIIPLFVYFVIQFEGYSERQMISVKLFRIIVLRLASIILLFTTFNKQIMCEPRDMCDKGIGKCSSPMCWETYIGQQMYRLAVLDFLIGLSIVFLWDTPRNYFFKKYRNKITEALGRSIFEIPTEVLSVVYSQTLCWAGTFYCPVLPAITALKIFILFYIKKYTVLHNCSTPERYKASRSNAIFVVILMVSFFLTMIVFGYSLTELPPSPACGPYRFYLKTTNAMRLSMMTYSKFLSNLVMFVFSPLFAVPFVILLCLVLYFYLTKAAAHKQMIKVLKVQLNMEGKDKQFLLRRILKINPRFNTMTLR